MSKKTFVLPEKVKTCLADAETALRDYTADARAAWDARSARWQESDAGDEVSGWLDELEDLADSLDQVEEEPS